MKASARRAEIVLCIPGPWSSRTEFLQQVITLEPMGTFVCAGGILMHAAAEDHVPIEYLDADPQMAQRFQRAGQGKIDAATLGSIADHRAFVLLTFEANAFAQRERLIKYTRVLQQLGGIAVKVESSGIAHTWDRWFELLGSGHTFDLYCAFVTLIRGVDGFFSCGMHQFGLPDCFLLDSESNIDPAELMNRFNLWLLTETPELQSGHTFSLTEESPRFRLKHREDHQHLADDLFHNPNGIWELENPMKNSRPLWKRWLQ